MVGRKEPESGCSELAKVTVTHLLSHIPLDDAKARSPELGLLPGLLQKIIRLKIHAVWFIALK